MARSVRFTSWCRDDDGGKLHVWGTCTKPHSGGRDSPPEGPEVLTIDGGQPFTDAQMDAIHENLEIDDTPEQP